MSLTINNQKILTTLTVNNSNTVILTRNSTTGNIEGRNVSTLPKIYSYNFSNGNDVTFLQYININVTTNTTVLAWAYDGSIIDSISAIVDTDPGTTITVRVTTVPGTLLTSASTLVGGGGTTPTELVLSGFSTTAQVLLVTIASDINTNNVYMFSINMYV